jgi:hypothetical protein
VKLLGAVAHAEHRTELLQAPRGQLIAPGSLTSLVATS